MTAATITQLEFSEPDFAEAERMAKHLGYKQTAYTSCSQLWGLFCLRSRPGEFAACIIKTKEFGLVVVQSKEDINLPE